MPHKLCSTVDLCIYFYNFTADGCKYLVLEEKKTHAQNTTGFQQMQVVSNLPEGQHWPVSPPSLFLSKILPLWSLNFSLLKAKYFCITTNYSLDLSPCGHNHQGFLVTSM